MDKNVFGRQINEQLLNDQSGYKIPRSVTSKNNDNNINNYGNIFLTTTGEISSDYIHRNNFLENKRPNVSFMENTVDNDEQFISNMKKIIDKNYIMYNKENCSIRNFQSRLSKKKKSALTDEDQNLMKRFKKSVDDNKTMSVFPQNIQQSVTTTPVSNRNYSVSASIPQITSTFASHNKSLRNNTNPLLFHVTLKVQKNDQLMLPETTKSATEIETEQFCYKMQYFTSPQENY
ncbi:uncharacterized protein [Linepithema humile]|uniref:uncharacterized protein n=1 Tax=Linepithema humile TaxID=83485 RepID=UPI0006236006|nr:PREDICTED: ABC transporter G family member 7-like [Linepithema humile]